MDILAATDTRDWYGTWSADTQRVVLNDLRRPLEEAFVAQFVRRSEDALIVILGFWGFTADGLTDASDVYGGRPVWAFTNLRKASQR